jgi:hypothetical protein
MEGRELIEQHEFFDTDQDFSYYPSGAVPRGTKVPLRFCKFDVLVLTYQHIALQGTPFGSMLWESIIIDEGHR